MSSNRIIIIGGGIVGLNIALHLAETKKPNDIFVLEKEKRLGEHASTRNSEVLHAGLAYPKGSLKSKWCIEGNRLSYELLTQLKVPHKRCGKWIVAHTDEEVEALEKIEAASREIGVPGIRPAAPSEFTEAEPACRTPKAVLFSETTGIIDTAEYIRKMTVALSNLNNVHLIYPCEVTAIDPTARKIETTRGPIEYDILINSAGLHADRVYKLAGGARDFEVRPFKGEYYQWPRGKINTMIYPPPHGFLKPTDPTAASHFGIHVHKNMAGEIYLGPSQVESSPSPFSSPQRGEETNIHSPSPPWGEETNIHSPSPPWGEGRVRGRPSRENYTITTPPEIFAHEISPIVKDLRIEDLREGYAGCRAKLFEGGKGIPDFTFINENGHIHLLGIESPGLTSAPAIARAVEKHVA